MAILEDADAQFIFGVSVILLISLFFLPITHENGETSILVAGGDSRQVDVVVRTTETKLALDTPPSDTCSVVLSPTTVQVDNSYDWCKREASLLSI